MSLDPARTAEHRVNLADALRDLRKASGLSGARLAERCQLSQSKISRIETGRLLPSIVDVERLLAALGRRRRDFDAAFPPIADHWPAPSA